jgi:hypothetical protein
MTKLPVALVILAILTSASLIIVESSATRSIPKPSVPQFTLKLVDKSYYLPPKTTSTTDQYNGQVTTTTIPGYNVNDFKIELSIKNQPFPSTINGNKSSLWYDVQIKVHFAGDWIDQYPSSAMSPTSLPWPTQSSSGYTLLLFPARYRTDDKVDFQVKAILGYQYSYDTYFYGQQSHILPLRMNDFIHEESSWSNTQTFTMPETSTSSNPTTSPLILLHPQLLLFRNFPYGQFPSSLV